MGLTCHDGTKIAPLRSGDHERAVQFMWDAFDLVGITEVPACRFWPAHSLTGTPLTSPPRADAELTRRLLPCSSSMSSYWR